MVLCYPVITRARQADSRPKAALSSTDNLHGKTLMTGKGILEYILLPLFPVGSI